jgi:hypothetical protein
MIKPLAPGKNRWRLSGDDVVGPTALLSIVSYAVEYFAFWGMDDNMNDKRSSKMLELLSMKKPVMSYLSREEYIPSQSHLHTDSALNENVHENEDVVSEQIADHYEQAGLLPQANVYCCQHETSLAYAS